MTEVFLEKLLFAAQTALQNSYCPYSGFAVGAAIIADDYTIYGGCNVENSSYSLCLCAERNALTTAVAAGRFSFKAIAIYHDGDEMPYPCGACLQVLAEFGADTIILVSNENKTERYTLKDLLPKSFSLEN